MRHQPESLKMLDEYGRDTVGNHHASPTWRELPAYGSTGIEERLVGGLELVQRVTPARDDRAEIESHSS